MTESQGTWTAKTIGLVIVAAVLTALLTTGIQMLVWKKSNGGLSGGAATAVAVAIYMARRKPGPQQKDTPST